MSDSKQVVTMEEADMIRTLQASLFPGARPETVALVLAYCKAQHLDPFSKPVHIVPIRVKEGDRWVTRDTLMPGINQYRIRADRTKQYVGISDPEFGPTITREFESIDNDGVRSTVTMSFPEWCRMIVRRRIGDAVTEWPAKEYWIENYATESRKSEAPNAMWQKRPFGQLAKCTEAQALRRAFPDQVGAEPSYEERGFDGGDIIDVTPTSTTAATPEPTTVVAQPQERPSRSDELAERAAQARTGRGNAPGGVPSEGGGPKSAQTSADSVIDVPAQTDETESGASTVVASRARVPAFAAAPDESWPERIVPSATLAACPIDALAEIATYWGIDTAAANAVDIEDNDATTKVENDLRAALVDVFQTMAKPALTTWATSIVGDLKTCHEHMLPGLSFDASRVAKALGNVGEPDDAILSGMRKAITAARRRLGIKKEQAA